MEVNEILDRLVNGISVLKEDLIEDVKQIPSGFIQKRIHEFMAHTSGVYFNKKYIIFTSESTWKNWSYYAGFEYIEKESINTIKIGGRIFLAWVDREDSDRVDEMLIELNDEYDDDD